MKQIIGVLLIVAGVAYYAFDGFHYTRREKVLDVGPLEATTATQETAIPYSPAVAAAAVAGGLILVIAGVRRSVG